MEQKSIRVGAAHSLGDDSIVKLLEDKGVCSEMKVGLCKESYN